MKSSVLWETIKSAPAVAGAWIVKMTLNEWVALATGLYIAIQALYLLDKWHYERKYRRGRARGVW